MNADFSRQSALTGMAIGVVLVLFFVLLSLFAKLWDDQQLPVQKPLHKAQHYDVLYKDKIKKSIAGGLRWSGLQLTYVQHQKGKRLLIPVRSGTWNWWRNGRLVRQELYCNLFQASHGECLLGRRHGKQQRWFANGRLKELSFFCDGRSCRSAKRWYSDGQLKSLVHYKNGVRDGLSTQFWWNGKKRQEGRYQKGQQQGAWSYWYLNGKQRALITWKAGKKHGLSRQWWWLCLPSRCIHPLHKEGHYKNSHKTGQWKTFSLFHQDEPPKVRRWTSGDAQ